MHHVPMFHEHRTVVAGHGHVYSQTVGNTRHTTGIDYAFLPEGARELSQGHVRFSAFVSEDGSIQWRYEHANGPETRKLKRDFREPALGEQDQVEFPAAVVAGMRAAVESLHDQRTNAWFFSALGAVEMELDQRVRRQQDLERSITNYQNFLADVTAPSTTFVPAETAGTEKGYHRPATAEETAERRAMWQRNLDRDAIRLSTLHVEQDQRVALLQRLRAALRDWSHSRSPRTSAYAAYTAAITA